MKLPLILVASLLAPGAMAKPPPVSMDTLSVEAQVLCALEGGPLILKVDLSNTGKRRVEYYHDPGFSASVDPPRGWLPKLRLGFINGTAGDRALEPGAHLSSTLYLHHEYSNIRAGKLKLRVTWTLPPPEKRGALGAEASSVIQVVIPPATKENVGVVRQRLLAELDRLDKLEKNEQTGMEYRRVADHVHDAYHPGLIPVNFRLLIRSWEPVFDLNI